MRTGSQAPERPENRKPGSSRARAILIASEMTLVFALLLAWVLSRELRASTQLWVLFLYSFPSEFLAGLVPHEPVLLYYGVHHPAWVVALVATVSTVMAEGMNYSIFGFFYGVPALREASKKKAVRKIMDLFDRMPFWATLVAGFTPVPFFPVRFLVVMTGYPVWKYLLAVLVSRGPRFYILALFGGVLDIPGVLLGVLFAAMLAAVNVPALVRLVTNGFEGKEEA
jgi:membrane protein YqaA with SNARE-associated domain